MHNAEICVNLLKVALQGIQFKKVHLKQFLFPCEIGPKNVNRGTRGS